ncbi:MAG: hypothetical protein P4L28_10035 [Paludibacteraceae bacterium]|nr:hypothetical protein [Paludibacteraceae bacterium]
MKGIRVILIVLFACCFTSSLFASSYPAVGYGVVGGNLPSSNSMLGTTYKQDSLSYYESGANNLIYYGVPFVAGDSVIAGGIRYILVPSPNMPGLLVADLDNDGVWDSADEPSSPLGGYLEYYMTPIGNGNVILIILVLLYATYILLRKNKNTFNSKFFLFFLKSKQ